MNADGLETADTDEADDLAAPVTPAAWRTQRAAERLDIPYRTLIRLINDGRLRAVPAGRYYLVPEAEIQRFLGTAQADSGVA